MGGVWLLVLGFGCLGTVLGEWARREAGRLRHGVSAASGAKKALWDELWLRSNWPVIKWFWYPIFVLCIVLGLTGVLVTLLQR